MVRAPVRLCLEPGHYLGPQSCSLSGWDLGSQKGRGRACRVPLFCLQVHRVLHELCGGAGLSEGSEAEEVSLVLRWPPVGHLGRKWGEALPQSSERQGA